MIKADIFDLDGTLVFQTEDYILRTVGKTLSDLELQYDKNFLKKFAYDFWYGSDRDRIIKEKLGIEHMKFWEVFWKHDKTQERIKHTGVYDDVSALRNLRKRGIKLGIVTGALTEIANAEIAKIKPKIRGCEFDSIVSNDPYAEIRQKPFPDTLWICLGELGVRNDEAIYIGNSNEDVDAAIRAQVKPVVVLRKPVRRMSYDSSVKIIYSLHEIENINLR